MFYATDPAEIDNATHRPMQERELEVLAHVHQAQADANGGEAPAEPSSTARPGSSSAGNVSQRSIANALGMSLGLTNAILKRLSDKGFLMMRRINTHNVHYLVTPEGIDQISRRSYRYLRRTIGHVVRYKERLREFCRHQRERGIREIVLIGESDLTFILEWCCEKEGIGFRQGDDDAGPGEGDRPAHSEILRVFSEHIQKSDDPDAVLLHKIVLGYLEPPTERENKS